MKRLLGGRSNNEILDSISSSRLARALSPLAQVAKRNCAALAPATRAT